jgi:hypothetical protein
LAKSRKPGTGRRSGAGAVSPPAPFVLNFVNINIVNGSKEEKQKEVERLGAKMSRPETL